MPKGAKLGNKNALGNKGGGRPAKFKPEYVALLSRIPGGIEWSDEELGRILDVSPSTIKAWKTKYPEFSAELKRGKELADSQVEVSMYKNAVGYSHPDVHISNFQGVITATPLTKHYPPNPTAGIFWLSNRQREKWRQRQELTGANGMPLVPESQQTSATELARQVAFLLRKGVETKKKG